MHLPAQVLKDIVVKGGFVSEADFEVVAQAAAELGKDPSDILVFRGFLSEADLGKLIAEHFHLPFADLKTKLIPQPILQLISEQLARTNHVVPLK